MSTEELAKFLAPQAICFYGSYYGCAQLSSCFLQVNLPYPDLLHVMRDVLLQTYAHIIKMQPFSDELKIIHSGILHEQLTQVPSPPKPSPASHLASRPFPPDCYSCPCHCHDQTRHRQR